MNLLLILFPFNSGVECFAIGDDDYVCGSCPPDMTGNGKKCYESSRDFLAQLCDHSETNPCFDKSLCQGDLLKGIDNCSGAARSVV